MTKPTIAELKARIERKRKARQSTAVDEAELRRAVAAKLRAEIRGAKKGRAA